MPDHIRVVLANTSHPDNIGRVAHAMKNMGLSQLVLVQPESFPHGDAVARASGATDILDAARVVDTLEEALNGYSMVLGTSTRSRRIPWPLLDPRECATTCLERLGANGEVALIFGRRYTGLTNERLQCCQFHVYIPSDPEFSSLNLAATVQMLTYEVCVVWLAAQGKPTRIEKSRSTSMLNAELVTTDELEPYYAHLKKILTDIGFLDLERPRRLMPRLRHLCGRSAINKLGVNILREILAETQRVARSLSYRRSDD